MVSRLVTLNNFFLPHAPCSAQAVLARLMWHLSNRAAPSDAQLLAPAQLLAILVNEAGPSREAAAEKGKAAGGRVLSDWLLPCFALWVGGSQLYLPEAGKAQLCGTK